MMNNYTSAANKLRSSVNSFRKSKTEGGADNYKKGGYVVKRSSARKGKTHVVIGPGGKKKYFGDSKLGQHPKDPKRKKAFYARHAKNLKNNPYFRAFARKTWADGGYVTKYKEGGKIHIKPENKGKFTAAAKRAGMGVQAYAKKVLANKSAHSPTLVKRANFARNAAKWKHQDGGYVNTKKYNTEASVRNLLIP
jgi:hypothetical protein